MRHLAVLALLCSGFPPAGCGCCARADGAELSIAAVKGHRACPCCRTNSEDASGDGQPRPNGDCPRHCKAKALADMPPAITVEMGAAWIGLVPIETNWSAQSTNDRFLLQLVDTNDQPLPILLCRLLR